jgi:hypothetical protein
VGRSSLNSIELTCRPPKLGHKFGIALHNSARREDTFLSRDAVQ